MKQKVREKERATSNGNEESQTKATEGRPPHQHAIGVLAAAHGASVVAILTDNQPKSFFLVENCNLKNF